MVELRGRARSNQQSVRSDLADAVLAGHDERAVDPSVVTLRHLDDEPVLRERPGVVNKLLNIIAAQHLNVLTEESSSVENRDLHAIELIVNAPATSNGAQSEIVEEQRMRALERRIVALTIEDLKFEGPKPLLKVSKMMGLRNALRKFEQFP